MEGGGRCTQPLCIAIYTTKFTGETKGSIKKTKQGKKLALLAHGNKNTVHGEAKFVLDSRNAFFGEHTQDVTTRQITHSKNLTPQKLCKKCGEKKMPVRGAAW